jgi:hypothetical protein
MQFIRLLKLLLIIFLFNNFHLAISFAQTCTANVSPASDCPGGSLAITANNTNITNTKIIGDASAIPTFGINSSTTSNATNLSVENRGTINGGYALYFRADVTNTGTLNNTNTTKTVTSITNSGIINHSFTGIWNEAVLSLGSRMISCCPFSFTSSGGGSNNSLNSNITLIENSGSIVGNGFRGIWNAGGTVTMNGTGSNNTANANIGTITNTGTITATSGSGIVNNSGGTIGTLNNRQGAGNASGSLTYNGSLPTNYNIIINSSSVYGKLSVTAGATGSTTAFGIYPGSVVSAGTYQDVLTGVTRSNLSSLTGTYGTYTWTLASDGVNYDLTIAPSRSAYNQTVTTTKLTNTATALETIRTNGTKTTLTNTLDNLSASQLELALKKIQGTTTIKAAAQPVQAQSNFKTALSTVTSPGSSSTMTNLTKTNQGNLTFADLQTNNLYAKIQPANYSDDTAFFDNKNNQAPVSALEFFKSNRNLNLVEKDDLKESGFFLRTFGSITNYAAVNSDDNSYGSDSYGLLGGFQHKIDENLYQGYSLGFSKSKLTLDAGEGNTKTNTIHANVYRKMDEKEYGATASLGGYVSFIDNVRNISETSEILKSSPTNGGLDFSVQYVKKMELLGLNFYPSASFTTTYGIVKNYTETGGSGSALEIKSHNVLAIKPEIGFTLENNFVQTDRVVEGANFSLFANRQQYLDGHTNTSSMIGENSWSASTLPKTKDDFLTAGIGYVAKNIDEKSDLNFNFFYTQSTNNSLNSSLFSISYNKTF